MKKFISDTVSAVFNNMKSNNLEVIGEPDIAIWEEPLIGYASGDDEYFEFEAMSKKEMEKYRPIENLKAVMSRKLQYRKDYDLGDVATVILAFAGIKADMEIISVETTTTESNTVCVATFGEEKISKFKLLQRRMSI